MQLYLAQVIVIVMNRSKIRLSMRKLSRIERWERKLRYRKSIGNKKKRMRRELRGGGGGGHYTLCIIHFKQIRQSSICSYIDEI